jgi:hypothetical protein
MNIGFANDKRRPIWTFSASGTFIEDSRLEAVRNQNKGVIGKEKEEEALRTLRLQNPKYGPDQRKEFVATLPIAGIQQITGCSLRAESAEFKVHLFPNAPLKLEWLVQGDVAPTDTLKEADCWASFEPSDGRLTAIGGFDQRLSGETQ